MTRTELAQKIGALAKESAESDHKAAASILYSLAGAVCMSCEGEILMATTAITERHLARMDDYNGTGDWPELITKSEI